MMKLTFKKYLLTAFFTLVSTVYLLAQNVADSDLSNTAGTNKNFRSAWWLFGVIGLVILVFLLVYSRRKRSRKI